MRVSLQSWYIIDPSMGWSYKIPRVKRDFGFHFQQKSANHPVFVFHDSPDLRLGSLPSIPAKKKQQLFYLAVEPNHLKHHICSPQNGSHFFPNSLTPKEKEIWGQNKPQTSVANPSPSASSGSYSTYLTAPLKIQDFEPKKNMFFFVERGTHHLPTKNLQRVSSTSIHHS